MTKFKLATIFFSTMALASCDNKPSDSIAAPVIRKVAEENKLKGLEVVNFERANGQIDPNSANLYKVTYSYDLKLTKPVAEVVLANAKFYQEELAANAKRETGQFFDPTALENNLTLMQLSMNANQWLTNQDGGFKARWDVLMNTCAYCVTWLDSEDMPGEAKNRKMLFLTAWAEIERYGFKDTATPGDTVPRQAWAFFSKTEKGWQAVN